MILTKQDVFIENIEEGKYWAEYPDDEVNGFWLKKVKQVYVLTKDDLVKLLHEHLDDEFWQTPEDFIESITSQ